ncbi:metal ABC transporter ATP-binding protein [Bifidobacterium choloepi]|uniref:metal ABC transporter ATP-binding protein n=1 Tax=Bifidobacterium choloepi TaxID=2614131 RepID=UPI002F2B24FD
MRDPAISLRDVSIRRGGRTIWSDGTFDIPAGTVTAIVGTNGAGKTTLMKAELGLIPIAGGTMKVLGRAPGQMNAEIGYVPQTYVSEIDSSLTAEQSVLLGLTGTRFGIHPVTRKQKERAREAMDFIGIGQFAKYRLADLSGGQRQRVAIAQALVADPKLLMLDEPLANLDLASQRATVHILAKLNRELGMTIQVVAHDLNMLLPILTGAVYLLDGHPHYAPLNQVLDSDLLTHLYGTDVQVVTTPQGDMFVTPSLDRPAGSEVDVHRPDEVAEFHRHGHGLVGHGHMHQLIGLRRGGEDGADDGADGSAGANADGGANAGNDGKDGAR